MQLQRVGESHVEGRGESQLLADAYRQHAAMHEHRAPAGVCRRLNHGFGASVRHRVAVHPREQANGVQPAAQRDLHALQRAFFQRVHHEEAEKTVRETPPRRSPPRPRRPACWRSARRASRRARRVRPPTRGPVPPDLRQAVPSLLSRPPARPSCPPANPVRRRIFVKKSERARRRPRSHPRELASGLFQCVMPAASASCVSPATLFTPSFFIIVFR